ncbi:MAG: CDP-alcohol phosphatidyltransferase [Denitrovibrio sp.]|nr:MAG: CDP-alcohol phosphatidyltransferase [Denitrovibrio sp.]
MIQDNTSQPTMTSFIKDLPNLCSLAGLFCSTLAIYFAIQGNFAAGIIGILWAVVFDWADGIIARKMGNRTKHQSEFGGQLDSLIDIVSFGVFPAVFLLSYGEYSLWFIPGAFLVLAASAIRLSYFNIFGLCSKNTYIGLALDNNVIILAMVFLLESLIPHATFSIVIYAVMMILMVLNIAPIKTPKLAGRWFYVLIIYSIVMSIIFGMKL